MQNLKKNDTNELICKRKNRFTDIEKQCMVTEGRVVRRDRLGVWIDTCTLLYLRCQQGPTVKKRNKKNTEVQSWWQSSLYFPKASETPVREAQSSLPSRLGWAACAQAALWFLGETGDLCVKSTLEHRAEPALEDQRGQSERSVRGAGGLCFAKSVSTYFVTWIDHTHL